MNEQIVLFSESFRSEYPISFMYLFAVCKYR